MKLKHIATIGLALMPTTAFAGPALNGAGATFPAPLYQRWLADYAAATVNLVDDLNEAHGKFVWMLRSFLE